MSMNTFLWSLALAIGGAILAGIVTMLALQLVKYWRERKAQKIRQACLELLDRLINRPEDALAVVIELKKSFPEPVVQALLEEKLQKNPQHRSILAQAYEQLGFLRNLIIQLTNDPLWVNRAAAAERLGEIGHPNAVLPLIEVLKNKQEERDVKNVAIRALGKIQDQRAISFLIEGLGAAEAGAGQPLADVLAAFGHASVAPLLEVLSASTLDAQRYWAARILGNLQAPQAITALIAALKDRSEPCRIAAAEALGQLNAGAGLRALQEMLLFDPIPEAREAAAKALGMIADESSLKALRASLSFVDDETRKRAIEALVGMGEKSLPLFLEILENGDPVLQSQAAASVERLGYTAQLVEQLTSAAGPAWACRRLIQIGQTGVIDTILRSLNHPQAAVRLEIAKICLELKNPRSFDALVETATHDADQDVRFAAVEALTRLGEEKALPVIIPNLKKPGSHRITILDALRYFTPKTLGLVGGELTPLAGDTDPEVRRAAVRLLGYTPGRLPVEALIQSLKDADSEVRREAALSLGRHSAELGANAGVAIKSLTTTLDDPAPEVRIAAVRSLGVYAHPDTLLALIQAFAKADETYRDDIAEAISQINPESIRGKMDELSSATHPKVKAGIAWFLGILADERDLALLTRYLQDPEPMVRAAAAGALGQYRNPKTVALLTPYLTDPNERVRAAAVNAIAKSNDPNAAALLVPLCADPDTFVQARSALSIGALAGLKPEAERQEAKNHIRRLLSRRGLAPLVRSASLIGLGFLEDRGTFAECLHMLHDESAAGDVKGLLKSLPVDMSSRFFKCLSLDVNVYLSANRNIKHTLEHYKDLLRSSRTPEDRLRAMEALNLMGGEDALGAIESALDNDPSPKVRTRALHILCPTLPAAKSLDKIRHALKDPSDEVRSQVLTVIKDLSPKNIQEARTSLLPLLDHSDSALRESVAGLIAEAYKEDWKELAAALAQTDSRLMRLGLLSALGRIAHPQSSEIFLSHLNSPDKDIRTAAALWAAGMGLLAKKELIPYLGDPQETVRIAIVKGLGLQVDADVLEHLAARLEDPSWRVRVEIAAAFGRKKIPGDERPFKILESLLKDTHPEVQAQSLVSLYRLGSENALIQAKEVFGRLNPETKNEFLDRLGRQGFIMELTGMLTKDQDPSKRRQAVEFLGALDAVRHQSLLLGALEDPSAEVRVATIHALAPLRDLSVRQAIEALTLDPSESVRTAAGWAKLHID